MYQRRGCGCENGTGLGAPPTGTTRWDSGPVCERMLTAVPSEATARTLREQQADMGWGPGTEIIHAWPGGPPGGQIILTPADYAEAIDVLRCWETAGGGGNGNGNGNGGAPSLPFPDTAGFPAVAGLALLGAALFLARR